MRGENWPSYSYNNFFVEELSRTWYVWILKLGTELLCAALLLLVFRIVSIVTSAKKYVNFDCSHSGCAAEEISKSMQVYPIYHHAYSRCKKAKRREWNLSTNLDQPKLWSLKRRNWTRILRKQHEQCNENSAWCITRFVVCSIKDCRPIKVNIASVELLKKHHIIIIMLELINL